MLYTHFHYNHSDPPAEPTWIYVETPHGLVKICIYRDNTNVYLTPNYEAGMVHLRQMSMLMMGKEAEPVL